MKPYELLGATEFNGRSFAEHAEAMARQRERIFGLGNYPVHMNHTGMRWGDVASNLQIVVLTHLGYTQVGGGATAAARQAASIAVDFFYGDYQQAPEWAEYREKREDNDYLEWSGVFRDGLFLATVVHAQEEARKLCQWVTPMLPYDESEHEFSRQGVAYLKLLAAVVDEREGEIGPLCAEIDKTRTKRWKMLRDALLAIQNQDSGSFDENISAFLQHFLKAELGRQYVSDWVSLDASTLWNLALDRSMAMPELDDRAAALIVTQDTITGAA